MTECGVCCEVLPPSWTCQDVLTRHPDCRATQDAMRLDMVLSNLVYIAPPLVIAVTRKAIFAEYLLLQDYAVMAVFIVLMVVSSVYHACDTTHSHGLICGWEEVHCSFQDVQLRTIDCLTAALAVHFSVLLTGWHSVDGDPDDFQNRPESHAGFAVYMQNTAIVIVLTAVLPYSAILFSDDEIMYYPTVSAVVACDIVLRIKDHLSKSRTLRKAKFTTHSYLDYFPIYSTQRALSLVIGIAIGTFAICIDWTGPESMYHSRHAGWHGTTGFAAVFIVNGLMRPYEVSDGRKGALLNYLH
jgi:hypothetical protein